MLAEGWCWSLSQISDSHSARLGIVGERGRLRASSACHPCPCRDRARILTADIRSHHIRRICRGEKVQKGTCPSPPSLQYSVSVWAPGKQHQKFLQNAFSSPANISRQANLAYLAALAGVSFASHSLAAR